MEILKEIVKNTTTEQIEEYYKRRNKKLLNQNKKLRESALDISAGGGLVNTYLTRGIFRKDFSTPLAQSLISEEMANEGYFSLALQQFTALCRDVDLELSYNSRELNKDKKHKFVLDFVRKQINNIGGLNNIFEKVIKPSLRWGVGIGLPSFQTGRRPCCRADNTLCNSLLFLSLYIPNPSYRRLSFHYLKDFPNPY